MATAKRFYWMKLKESFMTSDTIDYFMSQPNGANYVVLYQMLCLKTINTNGRLSRQIGEVVIKYDIPKIQRDLKWFSADTIRVALNLYKSFGLVYEDVDGVLVLADHNSLVGSETDWAEKKRLNKAKSGQIPELSEGTVGESGGENFPTDIRDKRIDIRDKEIRDRDNGSPAVDAGLAEIIGSYEDNVGSFPPAAKDALMGWREIFTDELILLAIKKAALSGVRKWNYVNGILKAWKNEGVKTLGDVQARDQRRKPPAGQQPKRSAADDYDEIFGELLGGSTT